MTDPTDARAAALDLYATIGQIQHNMRAGFDDDVPALLVHARDVAAQVVIGLADTEEENDA